MRAEEIIDEEARTSILADLDQMRRMITETLSFARIDFAAEVTEPIDVTSLVQRACDDIIDVGADVVVSEPPHIVIRTKPVAVHRAITNLIENAVKYGKRARVAILDEKEAVELLVDDDGPGIPDAMQIEAFEPFRRLSHGTAQIDGTSLGLTVARSLARGLGREITPRNRSEGGLRATILT